MSLFKTGKGVTKISPLQNILTITFVAVLIVSNIISSRIFDLFGFNMTSAVFLFPITYILSDVFSEVYGYAWSRRTCYIAFTANLVTVVIFGIVSILPVGVDPYNAMVADAFKMVLNGSFACSVASIVAFVLGDFANDKVFAKMKTKHQGLTNHKNFGMRAIISSFVGELVDSLVYIPLAFLVLNPIMTVKDVCVMIIIQVVIKTTFEIVILPFTTFIVKKVSSYELKCS